MIVNVDVCVYNIMFDVECLVKIEADDANADITKYLCVNEFFF